MRTRLLPQETKMLAASAARDESERRKREREHGRHLELLRRGKADDPRGEREESLGNLARALDRTAVARIGTAADKRTDIDK